jgi:hypothetical protein
VALRGSVSSRSSGLSLESGIIKREEERVRLLSPFTGWSRQREVSIVKRAATRLAKGSRQANIPEEADEPAAPAVDRLVVGRAIIAQVWMRDAGVAMKGNGAVSISDGPCRESKGRCVKQWQRRKYPGSGQSEGRQDY